MQNEKSTLAVVGATGGAGTTRLTVEMGATLAREGHDVAVLDAAFATQGLSEYLAGRLDGDVTTVLADDQELETALYPLATGCPGEFVCAPAAAPFERFARAKTAGAARRLESVVERLASTVEFVLLDVPPVAANQAVAAVNAAGRIAVVAPATGHGADAVARQRGRIDDLGGSVDAVVANAYPTADDTEDHPLADDALVTLPASETVAPTAAPVCTEGIDAPFAAAVGRAVRGTLDASVPVESDDDGLLERFR